MHRQRHLRIAGNQRLGGVGIQLEQRHRSLPDSRAINRDRVVMTRKPCSGVNAPATTAADTSPIECPITASGITP